MHLVVGRYRLEKFGDKVGDPVHLAYVSKDALENDSGASWKTKPKVWTALGLDLRDFQPLRSPSADRATVHTADAIYVLLTIFHHVTRPY